MTDTVARPAAVAGTVDMSTGETLSPLHVNSFRISAVTGRLLAHVQGQAITDKSEFCNLCFSLARGIDYAVSNHDIPVGAPDLPSLLKQVCQMKNDLTSQAAIVVLMISVKSACNYGWFSEKIKDELSTLSDQMQNSFCSNNVDELNSNVKNKESNLHPTISTIMSRFYPGMKMGKIFSLVETKPGYDSYVTDLHISKSSRTSPHDKIYLFVAQTDDINTSACLISPQQVNILLNGQGVDKRTCISKDVGPQMPTHVTHMLKYGSNLLQVVGQFDGKYVIVIAFMSIVSKPSIPTIDYIPPVATERDSDNEIIVGPSRISLKCPLSFSRINIPVKGHSCKHLQCFDYYNYVDINSRRPLWRCPHCSQSVCFHDIRIDQSMVKILKEVGEDVSHVKISGDGSWRTVIENDSNEITEKPNDSQPLIQETQIQNVDDIMDLTDNANESDEFDKDDDDNDNDDDDDDDDYIPSPFRESSVRNNKFSPNMENRFWKKLYSSAVSNNRRKRNVDNNMDLTEDDNEHDEFDKDDDDDDDDDDYIPSPVGNISPNTENRYRKELYSRFRKELYSSARNDIRKKQNVDDIINLTEDDNESNEFDKDDDDDDIPSPVGKSSVMNNNNNNNNNISPNTQNGFLKELYSSALSDIRMKWNHLLHNSLTKRQSQRKSQTPVSSSSMQSQQNENSNNNNNSNSNYNNNNNNNNGPTPATWVTRKRTTFHARPAQHFSRTVDGDKQHNFSRSNLNQHTSSQSEDLLSSENHNSPQPVISNRHTSPLSINNFSSHQKPTMSPPTHLPVQSSGQPAPHLWLGGAGSMTSLASSHSTTQLSSASSQIETQRPSIQPPIQTFGSSFVNLATSGDKRGSSVDESAEENWRPTGRMRGSLSGHQYTEALKNQTVIQPIQPVQATRPPPVLNAPRPFIPPHLQALMANNNLTTPSGGSGLGSDNNMVGDH